MVFLIFFTYNQISYYGFFHVNMLFGILERFSKIFGLKEKRARREVKPGKRGIWVSNCDFAWGFKKDKDEDDKEEEKEGGEEHSLVLSKVNFQVENHGLITVVGKVGCGKTSLLFSIMEETLI